MEGNIGEIYMLFAELTEAWGNILLEYKPAVCTITDPQGNEYEAPTLVKALRKASREMKIAGE